MRQYRTTNLDTCSRKGCNKQRVHRTKLCRHHVTPAAVAAVKGKDRERVLLNGNLASRFEGLYG